MKIRDVRYYIVVHIGGGHIDYWDGDKRRWVKYDGATVYTRREVAKAERHYMHGDLWDNVFVATVDLTSLINGRYADMERIDK